MPFRPDARTVFVFFQRTSTHVQYGKAPVFEEAMNGVLAYLRAHNAAIAIDDFGSRTFSQNELPLPNVKSIARLAGARFLLNVVVDRPKTSWLSITAECYDLNGGKLWKEQAGSTWALIGAQGLHDALADLERKLDARLGQHGLPGTVPPA